MRYRTMSPSEALTVIPSAASPVIPSAARDLLFLASLGGADPGFIWSRARGARAPAPLAGRADPGLIWSRARGARAPTPLAGRADPGPIRSRKRCAFAPAPRPGANAGHSRARCRSLVAALLGMTGRVAA